MSCAPSWTEPEDVPYNIFIFTFGFFIPLITIIITSAIVLITVRHTYNNISNMSIKNSAISKQQKVIKMVMILLVFLILKLLFCLDHCSSVSLPILLVPLCRPVNDGHPRTIKECSSHPHRTSSSVGQECSHLEPCHLCNHESHGKKLRRYF